MLFLAEGVGGAAGIAWRGVLVSLSLPTATGIGSVSTGMWRGLCPSLSLLSTGSGDPVIVSVKGGVGINGGEFVAFA